MVDSQLPPKKDVALALLQRSSLFIHLDPRRDGVLVPKQFAKQSQLVLQVGLNMQVPIPDLDIGEEGIGCTLSFSRRPHWCFMPWTAVYALVGDDSRGMVWPEDVPSEAAQAPRRPKLQVVGTPSKAKPKPKLAAAADPPDDGDDAPRPKDNTTRLPARLSAVPMPVEEPPAEAPVEEGDKSSHLSVVPPSADEEPAAEVAADTDGSVSRDGSVDKDGSVERDANVDDNASVDKDASVDSESSRPPASLSVVPPAEPSKPDDEPPSDPGNKKLPSYLRVIK